MQSARNNKNINFIKKAGVTFVTVILFFCVIIPAVYSEHGTIYFDSSEDPIKEMTLSSDNWWDNTWPYRKLITIDHNQIISDLINFPFLLHLTSDTDY